MTSLKISRSGAHAQFAVNFLRQLWREHPNEFLLLLVSPWTWRGSVIAKMYMQTQVMYVVAVPLSSECYGFNYNYCNWSRVAQYALYNPIETSF